VNPAARGCSAIAAASARPIITSTGRSGAAVSNRAAISAIVPVITS
jgi:hypothetical protein